MSHFDKIVKLACKPKAAPPKTKYIDPILAGTYSEDGSVGDICRALQPRFREPNAIVVFKALIVLHTMIRNGDTDNVLTYLSSSQEILHLRNVAGANWEGYSAPENLQHYAIYLDSRIRAFRDLKHDIIKVQSESNRDMRVSKGVDEELGRKAKPKPPPPPPQPAANGLSRGKTLAGRKLRVMTVEKGLLRETKAVQRMIDTLVECRFYLDDLEDELTITALRMLVKDLLILFSAGNEGVINVLEHYFEMSRTDAEEALKVYRHFCKQCERVVEYLGVAKKLQNLLNVQIPNMKHAPVSLAGALQEYLDDPNFEQNRIEYKLQKDSAEKNAKTGVPAPKAGSSVKFDDSATSGAAPKPVVQQAVTDFFESIETVQPTMFDPQTGSPSTQYFQQQATFNPFVQMQATGMQGGMQMQATGMQGGMQMQATGMQMPPFGGQMQMQPTGFVQPQATGFNPFAHASSASMPQLSVPQPTGFLQPQTTGGNPFRQSMLVPQGTGWGQGSAPFGQQGGSPFGQQGQAQSSSPFGQPGQGSSPFGQQGQGSSPFGQQQAPSLFAPQPSGPASASPFSQQSSPFGLPAPAAPFAAPPRPSSAPLTSQPQPPVQAVKTHATGSRNPFGPVVVAAPPVPKAPTMMELAMGVGGQGQNGVQAQATGFPNGGQAQATGFPNGGQNGFGGGQQSTGFGGGQSQNGVQTQATGFPNGGSSSSPFGAAQNGTAMSSIASSFTLNKGAANGTGASGPLSATTTGSTFSDSLFSLSSQPTGATTTSGSSLNPSLSFPSTSLLKPQNTGFGGLKKFTPSSSFGASLLESLPSIPQSSPNTPAVTGAPSSPPPTSTAPSLPPFGSGMGAGNSGTSPFPSFGGGSTGANGATSTPSFPSFGGGGTSANGATNTPSFPSLGAGLNTQATGFGGGSNNPFPSRSSQPTGFPGFGALNAQPTGAGGLAPFGGGGGLRPQLTGGGGANPFRASMFAQAPQPTGQSPFPTSGQA